MTNSDRDRPHTPSSPKRFRLPFKKVGGALAVLGTVGVGGAGWKAWNFVHEDLAPMVAQSLSESIDRPVIVGDLQGVTLQSLTFGPSAIPPQTGSTDSGRIDQDSATVEAVKAKFDLWDTLIRRTLTLDLTLVEPQAYIDQTPDGAWIETQLVPSEDGLIKLEIGRVELENGNVTVNPFQGAARRLEGLNGSVSVSDNNENATFNLTGHLDSGGRIQTQGQWQGPQKRLALKTNAKAVEITPLLGFVPDLPVNIRSGQANGNFQMVYSPKAPINVKADARIVDGNAQLKEPNIQVAAQALDVDMSITAFSNQAPKLEGDIQVKRANAKVPEDLILKTGRSQFQEAQDVNGTITFVKPSQARFDLAGRLTAGGTFKSTGVTALDLSKTNILLRAQAVPASLLDRAYQLPINITDGNVNANLLVKLQKDQRPNLKGWAKLQNVDAAIPRMPNAFYDANGFVRVSGLAATLESVSARYGAVPLVARGKIDPDQGYGLTVKVPPVEVNQALKTLQVETLPVPLVGQVTVPNLQVTGAINAPVLAGTVQNQGEATIDRVPFRQLSADFRLVLPHLRIQNIIAKPTDGGLANGTASYRITDGQILANLDATAIPGNAMAQRYGASPNLQVGAIAAQVKVTGQAPDLSTQVDFQAPQAIYATQGQLLVRGETMQLREIVSQVAGGQVFTSGLIQDGQLTAQVRPQNIQLNQFSPDLRGALDGSIAIAAPLANLSPQTLRAQGDVRLSQGLSLIETPIESAIAWNGRYASIDANAPGFRAYGDIGASFDGPTGPQPTTLDLALNLNQFPLQTLADLGPTEIDLDGTTSLVGQISGTVNAPRLKANLAVNDLAVAQVPFESRMAGNLAYGSQGVDLKIGGDRDTIQVALASDFLPNRFRVQRDQAIAQGRRQGNQLVASIQQFPLQMLSLQPAPEFGVGTITGLASADVTANLTTYATQGSFDVKQPALGALVGDRARGAFRYQAGLAQLIGGTLEKRDSRYELDATLKLDEDPDVTGELTITQGQIADVLFLAQGINGSASPLGNAQDLQLDAVGYPQAPISIQLQRLTEIQELIAQTEKQQEKVPLSLADLTGQYQGKIAFQGSAQTGVEGSFDLVGNDFQLGEYNVETATARGDLKGTQLTFEPFKLATGDRVAQYTGSLGLSQQSGQLEIRNVPIDPLNRFAELPAPVTGNINSVATIGGSLLNPTVNGNANLTAGEVNQVPLQEAKVTFNYQQARLAMDGFARLDNPEPLTLTANIPYALPFSSVVPSSNKIAIDANLRDEGLGLINLLTDQVAWVDGQGLLSLKVRGSLAQPVAMGTLKVQNATLTSPTIEKPITAVSGIARFNQDQIQIEQLVGRHGDTGENQGTISASGFLPVFDPELLPNSALTINLKDLDLKLKNLYDGEVGGTILVTGAALAPSIGGEVQVQNGKVVLTDVAAAGGTEEANSEEGLVDANPSPIAFNQLKVLLGDRVRISQPPVLSFVAEGDLTVNGTVSTPRPEGQIRFDKGTINLFTNRFRVDPRRENVAIFDPKYGLDPYLDIGMRSTVFEVVQGQTSELSDFKEVPASSLGSVESVRIYVTVDGLASRLQTNFKDVVEITSDPPKDEGAIIALLGGGVTDAVASGQVQNAALNVGSSALLGNVQDLLAGLLGNDVTINAFPILLPNEDGDQSVLSFGAEVNYDVTDRFSVSAIQILTGTEQPTTFSLKYKLTDALRARTSIGSDGQGVGLLEYRVRF